MSNQTKPQVACDRCTQGVMDADCIQREFDRWNGGFRLAFHPGNPHLYGRCTCECHGADKRAKPQ